MPLVVACFPARKDNFGYLAHDVATGRTAAIDAPDAEPILAELAARGWALSDIFVTHHHPDHVEAIPALKAETGARVTGPRLEAERIEGLDALVGDGDEVGLGETRFSVLGTPGHTLGHIAYHDAKGGHLFTGDALFSLGVGRMFEGTAEPMWAGIARLRALPDDTLVYCGHDYVEANARFAREVDPGNPDRDRHLAGLAARRARGEPVTPVRLGEEKKANPFLLADERRIAVLYGLEGAEPSAVFLALRRHKDAL